MRRRLRTWKELRILEGMLTGEGQCETLLELPCGGGRMSDLLARHTAALLQGDIALGQVLFNRRETRIAIPRLCMTASATHIPLPDGGVDAAVCIRLAHHLHTQAERDALITELLRVSRRFAILSFTDRDSLRNRWRRLVRGREPKSNGESAIHIAELAHAQGATLVAAPAVSRLGSCHRFALLRKG